MWGLGMEIMLVMVKATGQSSLVSMLEDEIESEK